MRVEVNKCGISAVRKERLDSDANGASRYAEGSRMKVQQCAIIFAAVVATSIGLSQIASAIVVASNFLKGYENHISYYATA